jgi:hypothetical protein
MRLMRSFVVLLAMIAVAGPVLACCQPLPRAETMLHGAEEELSCADMPGMGGSTAPDENGCDGCPDCAATAASLETASVALKADPSEPAALMPVLAQFPGFQEPAMERKTGPPREGPPRVLTPVHLRDRLLI